MAKSPIPINQALGRFYPGGPLPRRPYRPYGSRKPIVFKDFDQYYEEFFDMVNKDANIGNYLGKWFGGELKADFNQAMKAQVTSPSSAKAADIPEEFAADIQELPGAVGVAINLNPVDWIKKPKKESTKLLNSIIEGTFGYNIEKNTWNFSDVDASIEKDFVWAPLVRGERIGNSKLTSGFSKQNAFARVLEERLLNKPVEDVSSANFSGTGLSAKETGDLIDYINNKDSYVIGQGFISKPTNPTGDAQDAFVKGMTSFQAAGAREDGFTNIGTSFLKVLDVESKDKRPIQYNILDPEVQKLLQGRIQDIRGKNTPVLDPFGNDFLSMTASTINGYIAEREDLTDNEIPRLEKELAKLSSKSFKDEDDKKELKAVEKALDAAKKKLPKLNGNIYASVEQLVGSGNTSYAGALPTVLKELKDVSTDADFVKLRDSLSVFVDPNTEILKTVSSLRHTLFELDKLDASDSNNNTHIQELTNDVNALTASLNANKHVLNSVAADASISPSLLSATTYDLSSISDLETNIVGYIDKSLDETRGYLKKSALVTDGSFLFREQTAYLNGLHDFYGSFKDLETTLKKKGFEDARKELIESYQGQIDAYNSTRNLLMGDPLVVPNPKPGNPAAAAEFEKIFGSHITALEKMKSDIDSLKKGEDLKDLLKKYKSVYNTETLNGGIGDKVTRRFMESVYFTDGPLAQTFQASEDKDTYEHSKRLYLIARFRYEKEKARDLYSMIKSGPKGVINPLFQKYIKEGQVGKTLKPFFKAYKYASRPKDLIKELILEPTYYFGLIYDKDMEKECAKDKGVREWINKNIGKRLINSKTFGGLNKLRIDIEGMDAFTMIANENLKAGVILGGLLQAGGPMSGVTSDMLYSLFDASGNFKGGKNALSVLDGIALLQGVELPAEGLGDVKDLLSNIKKLKAWFETEDGVAVGKRLGLSFIEKLGADGKKIFELDINSIQNNPKLASFFVFLKKLSLDPSSTDPTIMFVGNLRLLSQFLSKMQTGYIAIIANIRKPVVYIKTILTDALTQVAMGYLDSITGGLGELLRLAVRFVINTVVDWGTKLITAVMKFDLTEFMDEVTEFISGGIKYLMYFIIAPSILLVMLFSPMEDLLLGISPVDNSRTNGVLLDNACTGDAFSQIQGDKPLANSEAHAYFSDNIAPKITSDVLDAYAYGEEQTGIPCEIFLGIHFIEGGNDPSKNLQEGAPISPSELPNSVLAAAESLKTALEGQCGATVDSASFEDYICAMSYYNGGGGNSQCDEPSSLTNYGMCPKQFFGEDDPYAVNWLILGGRDHTNMSLIYPLDGMKSDEFCSSKCSSGSYPLCDSCPVPLDFDRPGSMTVATMANGGL